MNALAALESDGGCPDREVLVAFSSGQLDDARLETVAAHVGTCVACDMTLENLIAQPVDPFELGLRRACNAAATLSLPYPDDRAQSTEEGSTHAHTDSEPFSGAWGRENAAPRTIGPYQVTGILGRGGMGIVYRGFHSVLRTSVALKTLLRDRAARPETQARFRIEAEAIARLDHPNIVRIREFDECDGTPYFSMELVEGKTLAAVLRQGPLPVRAAAELMYTIAGAVAYAHSQNVLHRDLKPANVLIGNDGVPKVSDFGLAKILDEGRAHLTRSDAIMGTPSYLAPERVASHWTEYGPASDIYALGVILYEVLVGAPPFQSDGKTRILQMVVAGGAMRPSLLRAEIPPALESICLKCLELDPRDRYATAAELAEDLKRWLNGQVTYARRPGRVRKLVRRLRQRRVVGSALLVAAGVALAATLPFSTRKSVDAEASNTIRAADGAALPFRLRYGEDKAKVIAEADGKLTVSAWDLCLLEYLPRPKELPFRFRARVRHQASDLGGYVGLYFSDQAFEGTFGETHQLGRVIYNDIRSPADFPLDPKFVAGAAVPTGKQNFVRVDFRTQIAGPERPWYLSRELAAGAPFEACGPIADCWRELDVSIHADKVRVTCDGWAVATIPAAEITRAFADKLQRARDRHPDDEHLRAAVPKYRPLGGIGLIVERGSASFEHIELSRNE